MQNVHEDYLNQRNIEYRLTSDQFNIKECLACGSIGWNVYMSQEVGLFDCKKCILQQSKVLSIDGLKNIEEIKLGDLVLTKEGNFKKVVRVLKNNYSGKVYHFKIDSGGLAKISTTYNHKMFSSKGETLAEDIKLSDTFIHPKRKTNKRLKVPKVVFTKGVKKFDTRILSEDDFHWFLGWYIADGYFNSKSNTIQISFDATSKIDMEKCDKYIEFFLKYGINCGYYRTEKSKSGRLNVYSKNLGEFLVNCCGGSSKEKQIPDYVLNTNKEFLVVDGYCFGDGHKHKGSNTFSITIISEKLARQIYWIWSLTGKNPNSQKWEEKIDKNGIHRNKIFRISYSNKSKNQGYNRKIKLIEVEEVENINVYNLTIEDDNSYTVGSIAVHNCGTKGNFNQFRKFFKDSPIEAGVQQIITPKKQYNKPSYNLVIEYAARLQATLEIKKYLNDRGILDESIKQKMLGWTGTHIVIPFYSGREVINFQYRYNPLVEEIPEGEAKYKNHPGSQNILFNENILRRNQLKSVIITEGPFDAIILEQIGYKNVISCGLGAGTWKNEWTSLLEGIEIVYLSYDNDSAGFEGAKKVAEKLGEKRCKQIIIPKEAGEKKKDVTDFIVLDKHSKANFDELINLSIPFSSIPLEILRPLVDYQEELLEQLRNGTLTGILTGIEDFDELLGGLKKGHLLTLSGTPGAGKTSFAQNVLYNLARNQIECLFLSLEMPQLDIVRRFVTMASGIKSIELENGLDEIKLEEVEGVFQKIFKQMPLYIYDGKNGLNLDDFCEVVEKAVQEFNVQVVVIDHLHYFSKEVVNKTAEIGNIVRKIDQLAKRLNIPIILLCHLSRDKKAAKAGGIYIPVIQDLKDSSGIEQDSSEVVFICRDASSDDVVERSKAIIKISKNRGGKVGQKEIKFNEETLIFSSWKEDFITPTQEQVEDLILPF